jgi:HTH-type transcriptional regulator/antitoxin HigA
MKRIAKSRTLTKFSELPKSYGSLCSILMPRRIDDEIELEQVTEMIDLMAGHRLTKDQADYLDTLATLAADFENQHTPALPTLAPHELLAAHLENIGMSASAWGALIGIDRSTASRLLRGERSLTANHIRNTTKALSISPELLI